MKTSLFKAFMMLAFLLVACQPAPGSPAVEPGSSPEASEFAGPEDLVAGLYSAWLEYARLTGNPLVDEVYKSGGYFTPGGIARLEANKTASGWAADPVLCAQDIPENVSVESSEITGDSAAVRVVTSWGTKMGLDLIRVEGNWKIDAITCLGR
jgi:hypothetical protein